MQEVSLWFWIVAWMVLGMVTFVLYHAIVFMPQHGGERPWRYYWVSRVYHSVVGSKQMQRIECRAEWVSTFALFALVCLTPPLHILGVAEVFTGGWVRPQAGEE